MASTVWSDDFSDGNSDGWTIGGNFTVINGVLTSEDKGSGPGVHYTINWALFPSEVTEGTWKFDVNLTDPSVSYVWIDFITVEGKYTPNVYYLDGYRLQLNLISESVTPTEWGVNPWGKGIHLFKGTGNIAQQQWETVDRNANIERSFYNIIITRDSVRFFDVYLNESLILSGRDTDMNTAISTAKSFSISSNGSSGIDNIIVTNTIDFDKAPPHLDVAIPVHTIEEGQDYKLSINVTDPSGIDHWWLEADEYDNNLFSIDQSGVIRNNTALTTRKYHVLFSVNDTQGYTLEQYYSFRVVTPTTSPITTTTTTPTSDESSGIENFVFIAILSLIFATPFRKKRN